MLDKRKEEDEEEERGDPGVSKEAEEKETARIDDLWASFKQDTVAVQPCSKGKVPPHVTACCQEI